MRKRNTIPQIQYKYIKTVDTITEDDFDLSWTNNSYNGTAMLSWGEFCSSFGLTEMDLELVAERSPKFARLVEVYKNKCKTSCMIEIKKDPKLVWEWYKLEYGAEMSVKEKLEEINEEEQDNS